MLVINEKTESTSMYVGSAAIFGFHYDDRPPFSSYNATAINPIDDSDHMYHCLCSFHMTLERTIHGAPKCISPHHQGSDCADVVPG